MTPGRYWIGSRLVALTLALLFSFGALFGFAATGEADDFTVTFLDEGQADAAVIICGEQVMMIDGGNVAGSRHIYIFLKEYGIAHIDYMVCTHAHEDHVGGLSGALNACTVGVVYAPVTGYNSQAFESA